MPENKTNNIYNFRQVMFRSFFDLKIYKHILKYWQSNGAFYLLRASLFLAVILLILGVVFSKTILPENTLGEVIFYSIFSFPQVSITIFIFSFILSGIYFLIIKNLLINSVYIINKEILRSDRKLFLLTSTASFTSIILMTLVSANNYLLLIVYLLVPSIFIYKILCEK